MYYQKNFTHEKENKNILLRLKTNEISPEPVTQSLLKLSYTLGSFQFPCARSEAMFSIQYLLDEESWSQKGIIF